MILHEFPRRYHELRQSLEPTYGTHEAASVARLWLEHVTAKSWNSWQLQPDEPWDFSWTAVHEAGVSALLAGVPVQHVMGYCDFFGRRFEVGPEVLIPRQETEELVDWALREVLPPPNGKLRWLDIGTGSGCIAVTLSCEWVQRGIANEGWAMDISASALSLARRNAALHQAPIQFCQQDLFLSALDDHRELQLVISNPPYVTEADRREMNSLVLDHDPELALFAPMDDPLAFYRAISQRAFFWLCPGGTLLFEINSSLGQETVNVLRESGLREIELRKDLNGRDRMLMAKK